MDGTLPKDFPDEDCTKLTLGNEKGFVEEVKTMKTIECTSDPDRELVRKWMELHGPGKKGYIPWCKDGDYSKQTPDSDFPVFWGGWDTAPTHSQCHGFEERDIDPRFYHGRSSYAFNARTGEPWRGVKMQRMSMFVGS